MFSVRRAIASIALVASALSLTSCASYFVRKECEKVNWFDHGKSVAMSGRRLTGDELVRKCEEAEANVDGVAIDRGFKTGMAEYCQPETVFQTGKKGEFFNVEMCDGEQPRLLQKRHADGVKAFCAKTNGFAAGATGKKYNNICPDELEAAFMPEFNRGRKSFLNASILANETRIDEIESASRRLESERMTLMGRLQMLGDGKIITREVRHDAATGTLREETKVTEDANVQLQRQNLQSDFDRKTREIESKRREQDELRKANREMRTELSSL